MGRSGNGSGGSFGGTDPHPLLPGHRDHLGRGPVAVAAACAVAAWLIAFVTWSNGPWGYDFIALYSAARLVATGHPADVTDISALVAMERTVQPDARLNDPNLPALALLMAPLGVLPLVPAFAAMLTLAVAALLWAAALLAPLANPGQRLRLLPFALLAPTSLVALAQGQTTPFVLLAVAASLRAPAFWSGALLGLTLFRPQLFPLFALVALFDRRRTAGLLCAAAVIGVASFALVGLDGMARYPHLLSITATELLPPELGLPPLVRRLIGGDDVTLNAALAVAAFLIGAIAVVRGSTDHVARMVRASIWSVLAAPHALLHDGVMPYPAVATQATTTRRTWTWIASGVAVGVIQGAGIPVAAPFLLILWVANRRTETPRVV
jgi:glycosyl transferase family 87